MTDTPDNELFEAANKGWFPLNMAALCLNDETVFDIRDWGCPSCGDAEHFMLLSRWLGGTETFLAVK